MEKELKSYERMEFTLMTNREIKNKLLNKNLRVEEINFMNSVLRSRVRKTKDAETKIRKQPKLFTVSAVFYGEHLQVVEKFKAAFKTQREQIDFIEAQFKPKKRN